MASEQSEHQGVAAYLDRKGYTWEHTPNGGARTEASGHTMRTLGAKRGSADIKIFDRVPGLAVRGVAIEMKKRRGGVVSPAQRARAKKMEACGWLTYFAAGEEEAIRFVESLFGTSGP